MEAGASTSTSKTINPSQQEKKYFECGICGLREEYHYFGTTAPFCRSVTFLDKSYVMRDPFSKGENANFLLLGSNCGICRTPVCQDCSVFFSVRFCRNCYQSHSNLLPEELRQIVKKQQKEKD